MMRAIKYGVFVLGLVVLVYACSPAKGNRTGHEFMPDMVHSTAYEANVLNYYYYNTWGTIQELKAYATPRLPVKGTIARGYEGGGVEPGNINIPLNGAVPFYYGSSEEERTRAMEEIIQNPYPITAAGLAEGKNLYTIYCGICHGDKGDGLGYLVRDDGGKYPAQPAIFTSDDFINASNGRYYYAIMYGKNVMGAYEDKLSYEERWQVIHYIRSLQAAKNGATYTEEANTLNTVDIPGAQWKSDEDNMPAESASMQEEMSTESHSEH
ncbi:MAG TPA: c-type cytochrome [Saprospiraceae bacterium]|nr:c-type cytochrome [Saprospiraceae bacterium]